MVFAVAALGCASGAMPSMSAMHGERTECSSMFSNTFVITHKELVSLQLLIAYLMAALVVVGSIDLLFSLMSQQYHVRILLRARSTLVSLYYHLLQQFSAGILHPKIY